MRFGKFFAVVCLFLSVLVPSFASGTTFYDLEAKKGWSGYALLPPSWGIPPSHTTVVEPHNGATYSGTITLSGPSLP